MRRLKLAVPFFLPWVLTACGIGNVCEDPQRYESSQLGKRIEAPEGLDSLQASKELSIPEASPRSPRSEDDRCLELPPVYNDERS
jgi:uncharacterized lipoprotein